MYLANSGEPGRWHSKNKPFSNHDCGLTLSSIGTIMALMPSPPARVLDLGCGSGWTSLFYARHGYDVVGQDISSDMISLGNELKSEYGVGENLNFHVCDYEDLDYSNHFDAAVFFDCLHHADDEHAALKSAYNALKPGGVLITHEPGEGHSTTQASLAAVHEFGVNEKDMPPHLIVSQATKIGFRSHRIFPMQHDIHAHFYNSKPSRLLSKAGLKRAKRILEMAFKPSNNEGAIIVLNK